MRSLLVAAWARSEDSQALISTVAFATLSPISKSRTTAMRQKF